MPTIKAPQRFAITLTGDAELLRQTPQSWSGLSCSLLRLVTGEALNTASIAEYGLTVAVEEVENDVAAADQYRFDL